MERLNKYLFQRPGSRAFSVPAYFPFFSQNLQNKPGDDKKSKQRPPTVSIESSGKESRKSKNKNRIDLNLTINPHKTNMKRQPSIEDLTNLEPKHNSSIYSRPYTGKNAQSNGNYDDIDFEDDDEISSQDDNELQKNTVDLLSIDDDVIDDLIDADRVHASINQYKLKYLGSVNGMSSFVEFLKGTPGGDRFIRFWLDCEFYRDSMQDYDQIENMATRNRLFRDIIEKYNFPFSQRFSDKIQENYEETSCLSHKVFLNIQYDILRRLRSYWVPRYILGILRNKGKNYGAFPLPPLTPEYSRQSTYNTIPSTSKSTVKKLNKSHLIDNELTQEQKAVLDKKLRQALQVDKEAGGPFLRFISM